MHIGNAKHLSETKVLALLKANPGAAMSPTSNGWLPLHFICRYAIFDMQRLQMLPRLIRRLRVAAPNIVAVRDAEGKTAAELFAPGDVAFKVCHEALFEPIESTLRAMAPPTELVFEAMAPSARSALLSFKLPSTNEAFLEPVLRVEVVHHCDATDEKVASTYASQSQITVGNLIPAEWYTFRARCENVNGWSKWVELRERVRIPTFPGAPELLQVEPRSGEAWVTIGMPAHDGGSKVSGIEIEVLTPLGNKALSTHLPSDRVAVAPLRNGGEYSFRARCLNVCGHGPWSKQSLKYKPVALPYEKRRRNARADLFKENGNAPALAPEANSADGLGRNVPQVNHWKGLKAQLHVGRAANLLVLEQNAAESEEGETTGDRSLGGVGKAVPVSFVATALVSKIAPLEMFTERLSERFSGKHAIDTSLFGNFDSHGEGEEHSLVINGKLQRQAAKQDYAARVQFEVDQKMESLKARRLELLEAIKDLEQTLAKLRIQGNTKTRRSPRSRKDEASLTLREVSGKLLETKDILLDFDRKWGFRRKFAFTWKICVPRRQETDDERLHRKVARTVRRDMSLAAAWERDFADLPPELAERKLCEYARYEQLSHLEKRIFLNNMAGIEDELDEGADPVSKGKKFMGWIGLVFATIFPMLFILSFGVQYPKMTTRAWLISSISCYLFEMFMFCPMHVWFFNLYLPMLIRDKLRNLADPMEVEVRIALKP